MLPLLKWHVPANDAILTPSHDTRTVGLLEHRPGQNTRPALPMLATTTPPGASAFMAFFMCPCSSTRSDSSDRMATVSQRFPLHEGVVLVARSVLGVGFGVLVRLVVFYPLLHPMSLCSGRHTHAILRLSCIFCPLMCSFSVLL